MSLVDDGDELVQVDCLVAVEVVEDVGVVHQFNDFLLVHGLSELSGHSLELLEIDVAVTVLIIVAEDLGLSLDGLGISDDVDYQCKEFFEIDGLPGILDRVDDVSDDEVSSLESQLLHGLVDLSSVNGSTSVLIEGVEGSLEIFEILLAELVSDAGHLRSGLLSAGCCCFFHWIWICNFLND
jgi:hypothetical protein